MNEICSGLLQHKQFKVLVSALCGALGGVATSYVVNCTLVEITISPFFSTYFGCLFLLIGGMLIWRVVKGNHPNPCLLTAFACLVMFTGIVSFALDTSWFHTFSVAFKVPLYALLGVSICFALIFSVLDLVNYASQFCCSGDTRALVETEKQVYLVVITSIIMGFSFGFIFGLLDVEDAKLYRLRVELMREESICYPIATVIGALSAGLNQIWREQDSLSYRFDPLKDDDLDDDF